MIRLFMMVILLGFPLLELYVLVKLAESWGGWLMLYLLLSTVIGLRLLRAEGMSGLSGVMRALQQGQHPLIALLSSLRRVVAGLLFIFPGVISDVIAVVLLLIPMRAYGPENEVENVIEGQWRRED